MHSKRIFLLALACLLGGLRLTSTITTTTFVAGMSIANQDIERYFKAFNATQSQSLSTMSVTEERMAMDAYTYAFLEYAAPDSNINVTFSEEKARYGEGKILNIRGKLVHVTDAEDVLDDTACNANILGTGGEEIPAAGVPWIALVRRGRCTFEDKVRNVYLKGARGVIIYNDKPVMNLEKMQIKGKSRNITAVITYQDIGLDMARIVNQGIDLYASITEGRSGIRPINSLNRHYKEVMQTSRYRTSVLFVSISFIILMIISLVWLIFYYIQRFRYLQTKDQQSRHLCSVTKKAIMKIPIKTGKSTNERDTESDCCAICIETYKPVDYIRILPCKHEFHKTCIDPWLIEHRTCPMCKLDVLKFYGYVVGDQIHSSPNPQRMQANTESSLDLETDNNLPVTVVAVNPPTDAHNAANNHSLNNQQQQQQLMTINGVCTIATNINQSNTNSSSSDNSQNRINNCCHGIGRCSTLTGNHNNNMNTNAMSLNCSNNCNCSNVGVYIHAFNDNCCCASTTTTATTNEHHMPVLSGSRQVTDV